MYATVGTDVPSGPDWTFEPKYDGMRVLAFVSASRVGLVTRNGRDKAAQFPEVVDALRALGRRARRPLLLDGEVVTLERGKPGAFQGLQARFHLKDPDEIARRATDSPAALVAFDLLQDGARPLVAEPWTVRRDRLERLLRSPLPAALLLGATSADGPRVLRKARRDGWEGVIAKRTDIPYVPGARSREWLKLKLQYRAEFVIGGYTEPRNTRPYLGAILLGYFGHDGALHYVGHTGGGFDRASLKAMRERLRPLERRTSPFVEEPRTNEREHWVEPTVVVEVKFAEWTDDGRLRQPIFLGVRDDKRARDVHLERESMQHWANGSDASRGADAASGRVVGRRASVAASVTKRATRKGATRRGATTSKPTKPTKPTKPKTTRASRSATTSRRGSPVDIVARLDEIERAGGEGELRLGRSHTLHVSSIDKLYFPEDGFTKGDLMRYYARVSPVLLPLIDDRPLILKRYPEGIRGESFFHQNAGRHLPPGIRTAEVDVEGVGSAPRLVGGDLATLLYIVQIGTIAVHAWQSRVGSIDYADYSTIDLDPGDDVPFKRVVELAQHVKRALDDAGLRAALKTSGSRGLHIAMPLPPRTTHARSAALALAISARVTEAHPELATLERRIQARPRGTIYVDAQQNAHGKSVVSAYAVRARAGATVSAPLRWEELTPALRLEAFTIRTVPERVERLGDLWGAALRRRNTAKVMARALGER